MQTAHPTDCVDSKRADFFLAARHAALRVSKTILLIQTKKTCRYTESRLRRAREKRRSSLAFDGTELHKWKTTKTTHHSERDRQIDDGTAKSTGLVGRSFALPPTSSRFRRRNPVDHEFRYHRAAGNAEQNDSSDSPTPGRKQTRGSSKSRRRPSSGCPHTTKVRFLFQNRTITQGRFSFRAAQLRKRQNLGRRLLSTRQANCPASPNSGTSSTEPRRRHTKNTNVSWITE